MTPAHDVEDDMGLLSGLIKAGVAKKVIEEARKPHNQAKARELFSKVSSSRRGGGPTGGGYGRGPRP